MPHWFNLLLLDDDISHIHVGRSWQQSGAQDDLLALGQLDEVGETCGYAVGARVVQQRIDGAAQGIVPVV